MYLEKLKSIESWVIWKLEPDKDGRLTKVPYSPKNNYKCGTNKDYVDKWTTYEEAKEAKVKYHADGVGFVLPLGVFFLDIDHANLETDERVLTMMERFSSYAEISHSGEGLHIYGICNMKEIPGIIKDEFGDFVRDEKGMIAFDRENFYMKNPNNGMELYFGGITNRFAGFTGDTVNDLDLNDCTEALIETLENEMRKNPSVKPEKSISLACQPLPGDVATIVSDLRRFQNGDHFSRLYDGDWSGYDSQSEADLALCSRIAFRTGDDPLLIDEIFRRSGLYRKKWNRKDYREATIKKAISGCNGKFYSPNYLANTSTEFTKIPEIIEGESVDTDGKYVSSQYSFCVFKIDNATGKMLPVKLIDENIKNFIIVNNNIIVVQEKVYVYSDGYYKEDRGGKYVKFLISKCIPVILCTSTVIERIFKLLHDDFFIQRELKQLNNCPPEWINFQDCMLDVVTFEKHEHDPSYLLMNQIPWNCPDLSQSDEIDNRIKFSVYEKFVNGMIPDEKDRLMIMAAFGMTITRITYFQVFIFLAGLPGVGKSTLLALFSLLIGEDNCSYIPLQRFSGDGSRFTIADLLFKLANICADIDYAPISDPGLLKMLSGEDTTRGEYKHGDSFSFRSYARLIFSCNDIPVIADKSNGIFRRLLILKIDQRGEHIPNLKKELTKDIDLFIRECVLSLNKTLKEAPDHAYLSPNCLELVEEYRIDCDYVQRFLDEKCQTFDEKGPKRDENSGVIKTEQTILFQEYDKWRFFNGVPEMTNRNFFKSLKAKGFNQKKSNGKRYFVGIQLKDENTQ